LNSSQPGVLPDFKEIFEKTSGIRFLISLKKESFPIVAISDDGLRFLSKTRAEVINQDFCSAGGETFKEFENIKFKLCNEFHEVSERKISKKVVLSKVDDNYMLGRILSNQNFPWWLSMDPVMNENGEVKSILCQLSPGSETGDSVESKKIDPKFEIFSRELLLEDINAYLQSILDTAFHAFISIDSRGLVTSWNLHAEEIFGWKKDEILGQPLTGIIPERFREAHVHGLERFLMTNEGKVLGKRVETFALHKSGSELPVELTINVLKHRGHFSFFAFLQDISERKEAENRLNLLNSQLENKVKERTAELEKARKTADNANKIKSIFLANMSHEIRTPLGAVLGYSELLANTASSDDERQNFISAIKRNGELLSNIINDILDLSKVEAGKFEVELRDVLLSEVLTDMASLLNLRALNKGIKLKLSQDENVPKVIRTDVLRLRQILLNVIGNAIKFTEHGSVEVNIRYYEGEEATGQLVFDVKDTGPGISKENIKNLFQPFFQVDPSARREFGGSGLGLVLSRNLAKLLGGDVILKESTLGQGSLFSISINPGPVKTLNLESVNPRVARRTEPSENTRLDRRKILLAEDSVDNQFLVCTLLTKIGAEVDVVDNGKKAFEMACAKQYDIIVMDIQMPIMDGYEAAAQLRQAGCKTPMIALTAHALKGEREHCLSVGFNEYNTKPINKRTLIGSIVNLLQETS